MSAKCPHIAIALFGGVGLRFGGTLPKQFSDCGGKPLMAYALEAFEQVKEIDEIILVSHGDFLKKAQEVVTELGLVKVSAMIPGGESRPESVWNALSFLEEKRIPEEAIVLIQDGDRPNLDDDLIKRNIEAAEKDGAAITAIPAKDTVFASEDGKAMTRSLPRKELYRAQTPQSFRFGLIYKAYQKALEIGIAGFTDDASIALANGIRPTIVLGKEDNIKITDPQDLDQFLARRKG